MVHCRRAQTTLLEETNLSDVQSLRRIAVGLRYLITHCVTNDGAVELAGLSVHERGVVDAILSRIRITTKKYYSLLREAIIRFINCLNHGDAFVLARPRGRSKEQRERLSHKLLLEIC